MSTQTTELPSEDVYEGGFPKKIQRGKYGLKINERLKLARQRKKLSCRQVINELAEQGISLGHSTLQGYEADEKSLNHRYPSLPALIILSEFYDCSIDYIFGMTDKFKIQAINSKKTDVRDLLDSKIPLAYNGVRLTSRKLALAKEHLDDLFCSDPKS